MLDGMQTRFMLHEIPKALGHVDAKGRIDTTLVIAAIKKTGLRGRMIAGCRYWTLADVKSLEAEIERGEL